MKNNVILFSLFQLALDIEVESKESNRYMDDHMVKTFHHRTYVPRHGISNNVAF